MACAVRRCGGEAAVSFDPWLALNIFVLPINLYFAKQRRSLLHAFVAGWGACYILTRWGM